MSLGEGVSARVAYKAYATGAISSNSQPVSATDPAATGGQILRRTSCSLSLSKDTYQSAEARIDRQIGDYRHGTKRVQGSISGELSPGTYWDFVEAVLRGTETAAIPKTEADYTSVAADSATSKFTLGSGNSVTDGFKVGMVIRFTNLSEALNNAKNFVILSFGGTQNREVTVYPAPTTMSADTAFNLTSVGKRVIVPAAGHVSRKFAFEVYHSDLDLYRNRSIRLEAPGKSGPRLLCDDRLVEGEHAFLRIGAPQGVVGVGDVAEVFLPGQRIEIKTRRVRQEELIAGGIDHEFRQRQAIAVGERVFDPE